jgi:signal transduction histidine kinase
MKLVAGDLGFPVMDCSGPWREGRGYRLPSGRSSGRVALAPSVVSCADLVSLRLENEWLVRICRDYIEALSRAGATLGLSAWIILAECSGVLLEVRSAGPVSAEALRGRRSGPEVGQVLSLQAAGPNPVGLALDRAQVVLMPPPTDGGQGGGKPVMSGMGIPLGESAVPVGCLAILLPPAAQEAVPALLGQALFSARAIDLALVLRHERAANLEIAAGMAHEIRNPLTAVKGFLELTLDHRATLPEYTGIALRELDRAISLLEDYCLFSRAPRITPTQRLNVDGLLSETALVARGLTASGPPVAISYLGSDPDLLVLADPPRIKQILLNLCRNAVEAMPGGGILGLRAAAQEGEVVLEVSDTGVGVPPSEAGRIFEPFYTTKPAGTGLGLAVCRRVAEAHGGRLTFESRPGQGATFRLHLPRCFEAPV